MLNVLEEEYAPEINECGDKEALLQQHCFDLPTFCFLVEMLSHASLITATKDDSNVELIQTDEPLAQLTASSSVDDEERNSSDEVDLLLSLSLTTNAGITANAHQTQQPPQLEEYCRLEKLPVDDYASQILDEISQSQVTLIRGDTGCGKSSRIPVIIAQAALASSQPCRILVCEPKQLAASSECSVCSC